MEPVSVLAPLVQSMLSQAGKELASPALRGMKARVWGEPEQKALERALRRAFAELEKVHGQRLADFDINIDFWKHEGASELTKVIVPGLTPSAARLAERAVDSLGPSPSDDKRLDHVILLRPAFKTLLDGLADEVRREPALRAVLELSDSAEAAQAAARMADHLGAAPATEDDQIHYLRWVVDQHRYLRTAGVVRRTTVQVPLAGVFVGLRAHMDRRPGDRARIWFEQERAKLAALVEAGQLEQTSFEAAVDRLQMQYGQTFSSGGERDAVQVTPVLEAIRDKSRLLVLGDPGTGKTTILRYLALTHATAFTSDAPVQGRAPLFPIYVRIGEYARQGYPTMGLGEFLPGYLRRLECQTPGLSDLLRRHLEGGRCLVLLDGLDEITAAEQRRGVVEAVVNFVTANAWQGNRFVVTSRIAGYQAAPLPDPFQAVRLRDMDDETIRRFLDVYCQEVERAETPNKTNLAIMAAGSREAAAIKQALAANAGVRRLAANPLLLTALVLVHRASGRLPHRRVEAYVEVCNALGRTWRSAQGVAEADLPDERILTRWLTELGAWLHEHRPEGAATKREILEVLGPLWAAHHGSTWDPYILEAADPLSTDAGLAVIEFVEKADTHTGLLVERAPGRFGFAHLTFEEYYTGRALAFRGLAAHRITAIRSLLHNPRYDEPILLALGLIGTDYAEQIDDVITQAIYPASDNPSPHEDLLGRDYLFMLRVLADDVPLQSTATIDTIVKQAIDEYLNPKSSRCRFSNYRRALAQRLADLGATKAGERFLVALNACATTLRPDQLNPWCELARIAAQVGPLPSTTITTLEHLATGATSPDLRTRAAGALAAGGALTQPVISALVELVNSAGQTGAQEEAMMALTAGRALSEPVVGALVQLATDAANHYARVQAVETLAAGGALHEPVITAAVQLVTADSNPDLRVRAVEALAAGGALTEAVVGALVQLATGSDEHHVRLRAVEALAAGGALTQPVITATVRLAASDAHPTVREQAVQALTAGKEPTQQVITALMQLSTSDAHPDLRVRAVRALAAGGALTEPVITVAVQLATGAKHYVRLRAVEALQTLNGQVRPMWSV